MNTDGMISCFDCTSQLVSIGLEKKKEKRDESYALGKITSGTGLHSFLITFFLVFVCFWGNYSSRGGVV